MVGHGQGKGVDALFDGRHLHYKLRLRDLVGTMAERGLSLLHTTIMRWVKRFAPKVVMRRNLLVYPHGGHGTLTKSAQSFLANGFICTVR